MVSVTINEIPEGTEDAFERLWKIFPSRVVFLSASDASARLPLMYIIRFPENKVVLAFTLRMPQSLARYLEEYLCEIATVVDAEVENEPLRIITKALASDDSTGNVRAEALPLKMVPLFSFEGLDVEKPPELVRPFAYKRVFLIGDALHGCPPLLGMGAAMGFEDVCELIV